MILYLVTDLYALVGMDLYMDRFDASLDLVGSNTQASGITPRVEKRFEVNGPLQVKAALAVPVQFGLKLVVIRELFLRCHLDSDKQLRCYSYMQLSSGIAVQDSVIRLS